MNTSVPKCVTTSQEDFDYEQLESMIKAKIANNQESLFTTDVNPGVLWYTYLTKIPYNRQYYNCKCCRRFIQQYGGLVTLEKGVYSKPLLWNVHEKLPTFFREAIEGLWAVVKTAKVNGVFLSDKPTWGVPYNNSPTKMWTHLCGITTNVFTDPLKTASQMMAEKKEDFILLKKTLASLNRSTMTTVGNILQQGDLYRSEKATGIFEWLKGLYEESKVLFGYELDNKLWYTVANAPPGFAHVKNTVLGTLIEDVENGLPFAAISRRWSEKLHPLQYQRPTAAPTAGNVAAAEKIFDKLGLANSLKRRFARLDEIPAEAFIWYNNTPRNAFGKQSKPGLFSELLTKAHMPMALAPTTMTWVKFARDILPDMTKMELRVPSSGAYYGFLTAVDSNSPPIIQWDSVDRRNPFSWYFWHGTSYSSSWGLANRAKVLAIMESPATWYTPKSHHGDKLFFVLENCRDSNKPGICLFPEMLKSELREVRSTIEAYSTRNKIELASKDEQGANGICGWGYTFDVATDAGVQSITLDRFE